MKKYILPAFLGFLISIIIPLAGLGALAPFKSLETAPASAGDKENNSPVITLNAVGDIMLSRKVEKYINNQGLEYPIAKTESFLKDADITFANLECPLSDKGVPLPGKGIWFRGSPRNVETLLMAGFDIVSLANNHAMDYDEPALLQTLDILKANNIAQIGAGENEKAARKAHIEEVKNLKIGWLAYSEMADLFFSFNYPRRMAAQENQAGISSFSEKKIIEDIKALKDEAELIILSLHWGLEYKDIPEEYQKLAARSFIDAGADIIIGHHPHCIQGAETYKNGLIVYSLGNFIFDQDWSQKTKEGLILRLELSPLGWKSAEFYPVLIEECQPKILTGGDGDELLQRFQDISQPFNTQFIKDKNSVFVLAP